MYICFYVNIKGGSFYMEELIKRAEAGDLEALFELGIAYLEESDENKMELGFGYVNHAAEQGLAQAQVFMGTVFYAQEQHEVAFDWFLKAAEQGDAIAQLNIGRYYLNGGVVPVDKAVAFQWFMKAAEQGHAESQYIVGLCYINGEGVLSDQTLGNEWIVKAAEQGFVMQ